MKHILILGSLIFVFNLVFILAQPKVELSITTVSLGVIAVIYLIIVMLKGKLRGGSG